MKKLTRAASALLTLALLFSLFSAVNLTAAAENATSGTCGPNLAWSYGNGVLRISGTGCMEDYSLTKAAPWAAYKTAVEKVILEAGVGSIGSFAFSGMTELTSCTFNPISAVAFISESAFRGDTKLTNVVLPDSVAYVSPGAFDGCSGLTGCSYGSETYVADPTGSNAFFIAAAASSSASFTKVGTDGAGIVWVFSAETGVLRIVSDYDGVTHTTVRDMGDGVYDGTILQSGTPWNSVTYRTKIKVVYISNGISNLGFRAFYGANKLEYVTLGNHIHTIEMEAFKNCINLRALDLPESMKGGAVEANAFNITGSEVRLEVVTTRLQSGDITIDATNTLLLNKIRYGQAPNRYTDASGDLGDTGLKWSFTGNDGSLDIIAFDTSKSCVIPDYTGAGEAPWSNGNIAGGVTKITLSGVKEVGNNAFANLISLTEVSTDSGLTRVGKNAFLGCASLTSAKFGGTDLTRLTIESGNLSFSTKLKDYNNNTSVTDTLVLSESGSFDWTFDYTKSELTILPNTATATGELTFSTAANNPWNCVKGCIQAVKIGNGLTGIGTNAFDGAAELLDVTFSITVSTIGEGAFAGDGALSKLTFMNDHLSIAQAAFPDSNELVNVYFAGKSANLSVGTENGNLSAVVFCAGDGVSPTPTPSGSPTPTPSGSPTPTPSGSPTPTPTATPTPPPSSPVSGSCGDSAKWKFDTDTKILTIYGTGVMKDYSSADIVPWNALRNDIQYVSLYGINKVGANAFSGCAKLYRVDFDDQVTAIGENAFLGCKKLSSPKLPAGLQVIGQNAFKGCTSIDKLELPAGLKTVSAGAFCDCTGLTDITIMQSGTVKIMENAFLNCPSDAVAVIKTNLGPLDFSAQGNTILYSAMEKTKSGEIAGTDILWTLDMAERQLVFVGNGKLESGKMSWSNIEIYVENVVFGEGITAVGDGFLEGKSRLKSVDMQSTVLTEIGESTFRNCTSLQTVKFADSLTTLGAGAFEGCKALTGVNLSGTHVTVLPMNCFKSCSALETFRTSYYLETIESDAFRSCTGLKTVALLGNIHEVKTGAFYGCTALETLMFMRDGKLTAIPYGVFEGCSAISTVYFDGSESEWNQMKTNADDKVKAATLVKRVYLTVLIEAENMTGELHAPLIFDGEPYESITITNADKPQIANYTASKISSWSMEGESSTETLKYVGKPYTVTVTCVDENGVALLENPISKQVNYGASFRYEGNESDFNIPGYKIVEFAGIDAMPAKNQEITVVYRLETFEITVKYVDQYGNVIGNDQLANVKTFFNTRYTDECVIPLGNLEGYTVSAFADHNVSEVQGIVTQDEDGNMVLSRVTANGIVTLVYHKPYEITVLPRDENGDQLLLDGDGHFFTVPVVQVIYGESVMVYAPDIPGMTPTENFVYLPEYKGDVKTVTFTYQTNTYVVDVKVTHEEPANAQDLTFPDDTTNTVKHGQTFSVGLPAVEGYEIYVNGEKTTGSSYKLDRIVAATDLKIEYKIIRCDVVFRFVDPEGFALGDTIVKQYRWYDTFTLPEDEVVDAYSPEDKGMSGEVNAARMEVTVPCRAKTFKLQVRLVNEAGELVESRIGEFVGGQPVDFGLELPTGYDSVGVQSTEFMLKQNRLQGTMPTADVNLNVVVRVRTHRLTVLFQNSAGSYAADFTVNEGEDYTQTVLAYMAENGLEAEEAFVGGVMGENDTMLTVKITNEVVTTPTATDTPTPTGTEPGTGAEDNGRLILIVALIAVLLLVAVVLGYVKFRKR